MREIDDLSAAHEALELARRRADGAAGDRAAWVAAQEAVWAAEAGLAGAKEQLGLVFALLLRCGVDAPTAGVRRVADELRGGAVDEAGRVEWLAREVAKLRSENWELANALLELRDEVARLRGHRYRHGDSRQCQPVTSGGEGGGWGQREVG